MRSVDSIGALTAVVLAGGLGTRLRSVVADRPKVLADVAGRPFLAWLLEGLSLQGIRHVVLCTGYMGGRIESEFGGRFSGMRLTYSQEEELLGTGGALVTAAGLIESDPFLVLNGDSYVRADLSQLLKFHLDARARATILLARVDDCGRYGRIELDGRQITAFREKQSLPSPGLINAGAYMLQWPLLGEFPNKRPLSLEREVFPELIGSGLFGYEAPASRFIDIGIPEALAEAPAFFREMNSGKGGL